MQKDISVAPWERQPDESAKAYEAFALYRDMGSDRSQVKLAQKQGRTTKTISEWSVRYNWVERVRAYDIWLERQARAAHIKEYKDMVQRHIKIASSMQTKALRALDKLKPEDMKPREIIESLKIALEIEKLNRRQLTENERNHEDDQDFDEQKTDSDAIRERMRMMTDEELRQYERACALFERSGEDN